MARGPDDYALVRDIPGLSTILSLLGVLLATPGSRIGNGGAIYIQFDGADIKIYNGNGGRFADIQSDVVRITGGTTDAVTLEIGGAAVGAGVANLNLKGLSSGAAAGAGTLANAPAAGNPTFWIPVKVDGVVKFIPSW